jgi:hypothetical protein
MKPNWRFLGLLAAAFALWLALALAPGCSSPRPTDLNPAERPAP